MVYIKIHDTENGIMLAMCDEHLIDKVIQEGDVIIDIKGYNSFYKGEKLSYDIAKKKVSELSDIYSANIIGDESIEIALSAKIISKKGISWVEKIPYAHSYSVD
ncbi:MAG: DUF424 family protein [Candidatus Micrarchaeia archaeon]